MVKPVLDPNKAVAVCDKNDARLYLKGTNLDPAIKKDDVTVKYINDEGNEIIVELNNAHVKSSVLIVKMKKFEKSAKKKEKDEDEITVIVTNPGDPDPGEANVPIVFDDTP